MVTTWRLAIGNATLPTDLPLFLLNFFTWAVVKFRKREASEGREPAQVPGSIQGEMVWTGSGHPPLPKANAH
jgi:hypothetical protein